MSKNSKCTDSNCNDFCTEVGCGFTCITGCTNCHGTCLGACTWSTCTGSCDDANCRVSCGAIADFSGAACAVCQNKCIDGCGSDSCKGTCWAASGDFACWGNCINVGCMDVACQGGCGQKRKWSIKPHFLFIFHYFQNRHHVFYL